LVARAADRKYVQQTPVLSGVLALAVAQAVLPDEVLADLTLGDLLDYRKEARDAYAAFSTEIDRLAVKIQSADPSRLDDEIKSVVAADVAPRIASYKADMCSVRDRMFGSLIKRAVKWEVPTLTITRWAGASWSTALLAFVGALVPAVTPDLVDYVVGRRDNARRNAFAYLISAAPKV